MVEQKQFHTTPFMLEPLDDISNYYKGFMASKLHSKNHIIDNICYTELAYGRINKKLSTNYSKKQIESLMLDLLSDSPKEDYLKVGKNYYVSNLNHKIRVTINSYTFRIITVDIII